MNILHFPFEVLLRWIWAKEEERRECQQDTETFQSGCQFSNYSETKLQLVYSRVYCFKK